MGVIPFTRETHLFLQKVTYGEGCEGSCLPREKKGRTPRPSSLLAPGAKCGARISSSATPCSVAKAGNQRHPLPPPPPPTQPSLPFREAGSQHRARYAHPGDWCYRQGRVAFEGPGPEMDAWTLQLASVLFWVLKGFYLLSFFLFIYI